MKVEELKQHKDKQQYKKDNEYISPKVLPAFKNGIAAPKAVFSTFYQKVNKLHYHYR